MRADTKETRRRKRRAKSWRPKETDPAAKRREIYNRQQQNDCPGDKNRCETGGKKIKERFEQRYD